MKSAINFVLEAHEALNRATHSKRGYDRSAEAEVQGLSEMARLTRTGDLGSKDLPSVGQFAERALQRGIESRLDDVTLKFFRGERFLQNSISDKGMRSGPPFAMTRAGGEGYGQRAVSQGAVTVLRDLSAEKRTYVAANEGSDPAGGYLAPAGFQYEVTQRMKQFDRIFDACRWLYEPGTGTFNFPAVDATDSGIDAAVLSENSPIVQGPNPVFSNTQFPKASLWSSPQFVYSLQLEQDSGVPALRD
jgi:HK97 family phage major capsid protein